jgi:ABC-type proline/glycine betaine transport systems, periplasmic components
MSRLSPQPSAVVNSARHEAGLRLPLAALSAAALGVAALFAAPAAQAADAPACEVNHPVRFGGMNWESNLVLTEIERRIMEKGYGCETDVLPTEALPALAALGRGDLDVNSEIWQNSVAEPWAKAAATGKVKSVGTAFMGAEAWYIPRYVAERFPDLKSVKDLPKHKEDFVDNEDPDKGRFYGCPAGWGCEVVTSQIFKGDKELAASFNLFSPGTGAAQKAALTSAYKRKKNIVFYYWSPTPVVGSMDLVKLEMPPYDEAKHKCLTDPDCPNPEIVDYPQNPVLTAVNTKFSEQAPKATEFLSKVSLPVDVVNAALAHMEEESLEAPDVANWFLKNHEEVWTKWVPADVAERVKAGL